VREKNFGTSKAGASLRPRHAAPTVPPLAIAPPPPGGASPCSKAEEERRRPQPPNLLAPHLVKAEERGDVR
jgi:hypothetical protein